MKNIILIFTLLFFLIFPASAQISIYSYSYDAAGQLLVSNSSNGAVYKYVYDRNGNRIKKIISYDTKTSRYATLRGSVVSGAVVLLKSNDESTFRPVSVSDEFGISALPVNSINVGDTLLFSASGYYDVFVPISQLDDLSDDMSIAFIPKNTGVQGIVNPYLRILGDRLIYTSPDVKLILGGSNVEKYFIKQDSVFVPLYVYDRQADYRLHEGKNDITVMMTSAVDTFVTTKAVYYYPENELYAKVFRIRVNLSGPENQALVYWNNNYVTTISKHSNLILVPRQPGQLRISSFGYNDLVANIYSDTTLTYHYLPKQLESYTGSVDFNGRKCLYAGGLTLLYNAKGKVDIQKQAKLTDTTGLAFVSPVISIKKYSDSNLRVSFVLEKSNMPDLDNLLFVEYKDGKWTKHELADIQNLSIESEFKKITLSNIKDRNYAFALVIRQAPIVKEPVVIDNCQNYDSIGVAVNDLFEKPDNLDDTMTISFDTYKSLTINLLNDTLWIKGTSNLYNTTQINVWAYYDGLSAQNSIILKTTDNPIVETFDLQVNEDDTLQFAYDDFASHFQSNNGTLDTLKIVTLPAHGQLFIKTDSALYNITQGSLLAADSIGKMIYVPAPDWNGVDSFAYNARDNIGYALTDAFVRIKVNPMNEVPQITVQPENQTVCERDSATFMVQATGGGLNYQWYHNYAPIGIGTDSVLKIYNVSLSDTGIYYCMVYNDIDTTFSDTVRLIVNTVPKPEIIGDTSVCQFTKANYFVNENSQYSSLWTLNNLRLVSNNNDTSFITVEFNLAGNSTLIYQRTDKQTGCANYDTLNIYVKENAYTKIVTDGEGTLLCPNTNKEYYVSGIADSTIWQIPELECATIMTDNHKDTIIVHTLDCDTVFHIYVLQINDNGCSNADTLAVKILNPNSPLYVQGDSVIVMPTIYSEYNLIGEPVDDFDVFLSDSEAYKNILKGKMKATIYWNDESEANSVILQVVYWRCDKQYTTEPYIIKFINYYEIKKEIKIYPNPSHDFITIELPKKYLGNSLKLLSLTGRVLKSKMINSTKIKLNISNLSAGVYILRIQNVYIKIIKK